jgi:hypothetical protein
MASAAPIPIGGSQRLSARGRPTAAEFGGLLFGRETYRDAAYKNTPSPAPVMAVESESESVINLNHSQ